MSGEHNGQDFEYELWYEPGQWRGTVHGILGLAQRAGVLIALLSVLCGGWVGLGLYARFLFVPAGAMLMTAAAETIQKHYFPAPGEAATSEPLAVTFRSPRWWLEALMLITGVVGIAAIEFTSETWGELPTAVKIIQVSAIVVFVAASLAYLRWARKPGSGAGAGYAFYRGLVSTVLTGAAVIAFFGFLKMFIEWQTVTLPDITAAYAAGILLLAAGVIKARDKFAFGRGKAAKRAAGEREQPSPPRFEPLAAGWLVDGLYWGAQAVAAGLLYMLWTQTSGIPSQMVVAGGTLVALLAGQVKYGEHKPD